MACPASVSARVTLNQEALMSSRGKKKTTMAKLSRESRLRERRQEKEARKEARKQAATTETADDLRPSLAEPQPPTV